MKTYQIKCPNCNGHIQIDTSREFGFCSYCGTKIMFSEDGPANATQAYANNRDAALAEMHRIMKYFEQISDEFNSLDELNDDIAHKKNFSCKWIVFLGINLILFGIIFLLNSLLPLGLFFTIGGVFLIAIRILISINNRISISKDLAERKKISKIIISSYNNCPRCPIGVEYCRPNTLSDIYDYIRKGRAETIKEAINLLEAEEHNAEMKQIAEANLNINTYNAINNIMKH